MSMFIYNRFISGEYDTLFIFKISLSFLILEVNYRLWSRFKEVHAERNCHCMFIYNRFISGEYDTLFIFKISLSFLILEVNYRLWSRFKEVNAERNCHEIWVSIRSFFMYNIQKRSFYSKRKFAAKSSEISPLLFIACKNYQWGYLQKGGEAKVMTDTAHAYTWFYQLTSQRRGWL